MTPSSSGWPSPPAACFHTADGGETWEPRNKGTRNDYLPEEMRFPDYGQCVHALVMAPGMPDRLYQQNHCGMYRSDDGGRNWDSIEAGLPSTFGFPAAAHPRDPEALYLVPLNGDSVGRYHARRPGRRLAHPRRRRHLAGPPHRPAPAERLPRRLAPSPRHRHAGAGGHLLRHHVGEPLRQRRRGRHLDLHRQNLPTITSVETLVADASDAERTPPTGKRSRSRFRRPLMALFPGSAPRVE